MIQLWSYSSPVTAMIFAAPTPVQYATPVKHAAPEQYDAPMMTVNGVDLNRDGISDVLQQPQVGIRRLSNTEHLSQCGGPVSYAKVVRTLRCPLSALMRCGQGRCAALPRGLCDRGRETRGFS